MTPRKTIEVAKVVNMANNILKDDDFLERDREIISAFVEKIIEESGYPVTFEKIDYGDYQRRYII